uniref:Uncharacterized protein n=1 Tax=Nothobranchius furzeri TaxID=105023 RepID=A0A8C6PGU9_NOTFU|nr:interferon-induced transmembrane protein 3-like [Nothobranchius furzeri]
MESGQSRAVYPDYLAWSIFNTLCCCLPLGIAAIIFSSKAKGANESGNSVAAQEASKTARTLNIIACVCGVIFLIIIIAVNASAAR